MKKTIIFTIGMVALVASVLIWAKSRKSPTEHQPSMADSLTHYQNKANIHHDSAAYFREKADQALGVYLSDSLNWDSLRADYDARIRAKIRAESARQLDTLRASKTSHL